MTDGVARVEQRGLWRRLELPTWALAFVIYAAWFALTWFHAALPGWLLFLAGGWIMAWHMSLQHEIVHGHPTRSRAINSALAFPPLGLWLPFERYRQCHVAHHRNAILTDPIEDPESGYVSRAAWDRLPAPCRLFLRVHNTLAGRVVLGPVFLVARFLWLETASAWRAPAAALGIWAGHTAGAVTVLWWTSVVCGMPLATYIGFFVYPGLALTLVRSFAEHRAAADPAHRTAIVERAPLLGLLFLHNNLHVAHHAAPSVPWFDLPAHYRAHRADFVQRNNGLVYRGYLDVARRYLLAQHDTVAHPQHSSGLVPVQTGQKN